MRIGVVTFPGSNGDMDCIETLRTFDGCGPYLIWHKSTDLLNADALILPGGFAHGDYLRAGAIARFSPVMREVTAFARAGGPVLGICNGFQVLTEAGMLPGALLRNREILFYCSWVRIRVAASRTPWLRNVEPGAVMKLAVAHGQGNYFADAATLSEIQASGQLAMQYCDAEGHITPESNHNGSLLNIAGITNAEGNVLGMMPHPERSADVLLGSQDGRALFRSVITSLVEGLVSVPGPVSDANKTTAAPQQPQTLRAGMQP